MLNKFLTFGLTTEQENRFRQSHLAGDIAQARVSIYLIIVPLVAFALNDFTFLGLSGLFYGLQALRLTLLTHTVLLLRYLRRVATFRAYDRAEFLWGLFFAIFTIALTTTRPHAFIAHVIVAILAVFVTVLAIPNRFVNQLILSLIYTLGEMLVLAVGLNDSPQATLTALISMLLANSIAIVISWQIHSWRRREFLAREEQKSTEVEAKMVRVERERVEGTLRESEQRYGSIFDNSPFAIALTSVPDGILVGVNNAFLNLFEYTKEEVIGNTSVDLGISDEDSRAQVAAEMNARGSVRDFECVRTTKSGVRRDLSLNLDYVNINGVKHILTTIHDITKRKQAEEALKQTHDELENRIIERTADLNRTVEVLGIERQRFNAVLDMLPAYVVLLSPDYRVPFANRFFEERFGKSQGRRCYEYLFNRTEPCEICETYSVLKTNAPQRWEWTGPDGHIYDIHDFPFTDVNGSPLIMEVGLDITEEKKAQEELKKHRDNLESLVREQTNDLRESEEQLRTLYATMTEGLANHTIVYDNGTAVDYIIMDVNPAFEKITGLARSRVIGRNASEAYGAGSPPFLDVYARVASSGTPEYFEVFFPPMEKHFAISVFSPGKGKFATVFSDISERKRMEEKLAIEQRNLQSIFDAVNVGMLLIDQDGNVVRVNDVVKRWVGKNQVVRTGTQPGNTLQCIHAVNDPAGCGRTPHCASCLMRKSFETVLRTGEAVHDVVVETELQLDGNAVRMWVDLSVDPLVIDGRNHAILALNDITDRKKTEETLLEAAAQKQAAQYARSLIEVSIDPLVTISPEGKITDVNEATVKATGVSRDKLVGTDFSSYFTEPDLAKQGYQQVFAQEFVTDYPLTIRRRNGTLMDVLYNASLYKDIHGKVQGVFAAARDVTVRKQASQYARSLIEASPDPLVTISPEGKITDVNEATMKATGALRAELVGTDFSSYFTEPENAKRGYQQVFAEGFVTDYPLTIRHRDGHLMDVLYNASLYKDTHGSVLGVFAAARDVTVQKKAELELRRHKENLEALVKERTVELETLNSELARSNENLEQFAYASSHDLQEPLRVMSSFSQLLEKRYKNKLDADADEFIGYIVGSAARMQNLISDLLAYSRAGHKDADATNVDCSRIVHRVVQSMASTIESAGGRVTVDTLPTITAHEASIVQLFQNLISNALKFRSEEPPEIHISARKSGSEWVFSVRDNGIGIEPQYSQRIFIIFQRLHTRDEYSGTGIGLSICKKIVDNLGGKIWVESDDGKGSTFYFTIPAGRGNR